MYVTEKASMIHAQRRLFLFVKIKWKEKDWQ